MLTVLVLGTTLGGVTASDPSQTSFVLERDPARALRWLAVRPLDAVVVDARRATGLGRAAVAEALEKLFPQHDGHGLTRRGRTAVLIDGDADGAEVAFACGLRRLPPPLVDPSDAALVAHVEGLLRARPPGKIALCLAGGGIEGLLYEVGAIRAIDQFLRDRRLCDFDLFLGISAGSILSGMLANGVTPAEVVDGLRNGNARVPRITRFDLFDPDWSEYIRRSFGLARDLIGVGDARNPLSGVYRALPPAAFAGARLRGYFERVFSGEGMSDSFEDIRRPLYVGATDQDTSEAVVFGEPGWTHVPIHRAVRASCALAPIYAPEKIDGRWFVDGAFTRTTNMRVAVKQGATMVVLIDPLVPIHSTVPGYVHSRGGLFTAMQGLKALINGRFDKAATTIAEMYPEVAFHLVRPEGDEMRVLSGSPMKFLYREEIEAMAFESVTRQIRSEVARWRHDFARHGVHFAELDRSARDPYSEGLELRP
ncbi:MAG: patatin-like phospholipase family protein [Myxococcales bacterium]|nr:patatin-like phospholipase family protein [Myxococcales bacterium]